MCETADLASFKTASESVEVVVTKDVVTDATSSLVAAERWQRMADVVRFVASLLKCCKLEMETAVEAEKFMKTATLFSPCERVELCAGGCCCCACVLDVVVVVVVVVVVLVVVVVPQLFPV